MKKFFLNLMILICTLLIVVCFCVSKNISFEIIDVDVLDDEVNKTEYEYYDLSLDNMGKEKIKKVKVECVINNSTPFSMNDICMEFAEKFELPKLICGNRFDTQLATHVSISGFDNKKVSFYFLINETMLTNLNSDLKEVKVYISNKGKCVSNLKSLVD